MTITNKILQLFTGSLVVSLLLASPVLAASSNWDAMVWTQDVWSTAVDTDRDGLDDSVDLDDDNDGFTDTEELSCGSDPTDPLSRCSANLPWLLLLLEDE
ncbi:hypothetical protein ACFLZU_06260 [Thermodesulfobacteriota bacterium]